MKVPLRRSRLVVGTLLFGMGLTTLFAVGRKKEKSGGTMDDSKRAMHALSRLTFGARPGEVEEVAHMGVDKWIERQLHPEKINDTALESRLAPFRTLRMGTKEIVANFPPNQVIKQVADGKMPLPRDPTTRAIYESQLQRYEDKQERKQEAAQSAGATGSVGAKDGATGDVEPTETPGQAKRRAERRMANVRAQELLDLPPAERLNEIVQMSPEDRRAIADTARGPRADALLDGMSAQQRETLLAFRNPEQVVVDEMMQAKLQRAIYSERQLDEVMTDFWMNHFNVFINKGADRFLLTSYERDAIRPHVLGKFEDLLVATAKSPAMLFYLDNWLSVGPDSDVALGIRGYPNARRGLGRGPQQRAKRKASSGLNENYGRELMELHTLSVNGGYSQDDVTEVAKVFTGWTLDQPNKGGDFHFEPRMHEPGDKVVLGHRIKQNGEKEGLEVLHLLARSPKTAHFISEKLAIRFVSDDPPPALVGRMAQTFLKKDGDIREVLRTMFKSPEFWSSESYRAKVKTPLEFVVSAVRASGADVTDARVLVGTLNNMGMMPYGMQPPTGYSMKADTWVNSSALLARMNFALGLAAGKVRGVKVDAGTLNAGVVASPGTDPQSTLANLENSLLAGDISKQTHDTISKQVEDPKHPPNVAAMTGLILGSPEFQRR